jgi:MYXO-CTERM domain-containing protein
MLGSLVAALTAASAEVRANGRFPAAQFVVVGPGAARDHLALRTTFGIVVSRDAGRTWQWLCEELFDYGGGAPWDPRIALSDVGNGAVGLFVGIPTGLMRTLDRCDAMRVPEMMREFTGDITTTADGRTVFWIASNGATPNRVFVSNDGGRSFVARGAVPVGVLPETIEVAESDARRVYVTGVRNDPRAVVFLRSNDGGASFVELPIDTQGGVDAWLSGVDPTNPDVFYVRSQVPDPEGAALSSTVLLRSRDGGRSFSLLTRTRGPMLGFALSGDGRTVWTGGPDLADGLRRSVDGAPFEAISSIRTLCLRWHAGSLYVCAPYTTEGFALARSDDGGRTVTPLLNFTALRGPPSTCASSTFAATLCAQRWPVVRASLGNLPTSDGGLASDASTSPPATPRGCGCGTVSPRRADTWPAGLALLALGLVWRRRRVRR